MGKQHVIQVPVDDETYASIVALANESGSSRAEVMREAFVQYNKKIHEAELDRKYREGYERIPDNSKAGQAQVRVSSRVLNRENWDEKE
ncbi:MAG: ribbon-helix-helix protein, CopG family [Actinobacteria bacterium]|nr:ribbon-helix-helix protein, CopG family [Actinomycetota bacterium]